MDFDINTTEKVAGAIGAVAIIFIFLKKVRVFIYTTFRWIKNIILIPNSLYTEFGDKAGHQISKAFREFAESAGMDRLEMEILHRHLGVGVYICSPDGRCKQVNRYLAEMFGLNQSDMVGYGWLSGILEDDRMRVHQLWTYSLTNDLPYRATYKVKNARTGEIIECETDAWPKKIDGVVIGYCGYLKRIKT